MILKSKLGNGYPVADPTVYLTGEADGLDPVFAGRLSALAKAKGVVAKITSGYRPTAEQEKLYKLYKAGELQSAAKPGTSWHEFRLAVDTSTQPIRSMKSEALKPYGLCKPIKSEGWHIQPIETSGKTNRKQYEPYLENIVKEDEEVEVKPIKIEINGVPAQIPSINYLGREYMQVRALADADKGDKLEVKYDSGRNVVVISSK